MEYHVIRDKISEAILVASLKLIFDFYEIDFAVNKWF